MGPICARPISAVGHGSRVSELFWASRTTLEAGPSAKGFCWGEGMNRSARDEVALSWPCLISPGVPLV